MAIPVNDKAPTQTAGSTTHQGWQYLAIVMDFYSRQIVGRAMAPRMKTALCTDALMMAYWRRKPAAGLLHHSDRGSQYTSDDDLKRLAAMNMKVSDSGKGQCRDNAPAERFFRSLKYETLRAGNDARRAVLDYLADYNRKRPHSSLGYKSPVEYEQMKHINAA